MNNRAEDDIKELTQDILRCRDMNALFDKWIGRTKGFTIGQVAHRIRVVTTEARAQSKSTSPSIFNASFHSQKTTKNPQTQSDAFQSITTNRARIFSASFRRQSPMPKIRCRISPQSWRFSKAMWMVSRYWKKSTEN